MKDLIKQILREEIETKTKVLIYIYFCDYEDENFREYVELFKDMDINFWVKPGKGHHRGFSIQYILDTDDMSEAKHISRGILREFDDDILILLSKQRVSNIEPVGENNEEVFIKPGRKFDKLVDKGKKGIYIL
jgi:hypothetical protein